ncbi:MAG: TonB-dependent receptor family protein [Bacteroides sp.]|nr:TonB-dependent receptor family protein [Bacteroides sp.]
MLQTEGTSQEERQETDRYNYTETIYSLYGKYRTQVNRVSLSIGLRMEHALLHPRSQSRPEESKKSHFTDLFPEISLGYTLHKERGDALSLVYNRSILRPNIAYLNPFQSRINDYTYSTGNPMLEPQYGNSLSLGGAFSHKYILRLTLSHSNNGFMEYAEPEEGIIRSTIRNGSRHTALRLYGEVPLKSGKQNNLRYLFRWGKKSPRMGSRGNLEENARLGE